MKMIFLSVALFFATSAIYAQNAVAQADGNYTAVKHIENGKDTVLLNTGKTFTDGKGIVFPVYKSKNDKLFVVRVSKATGRAYKMYLKLN